MIIHKGTDVVAAWTFLVAGCCEDDERPGRWHAALDVVAESAARMADVELLCFPFVATLRSRDTEGQLCPSTFDADSIVEIMETLRERIAANGASFGRVAVQGSAVVHAPAGQSRTLPGVLGIDCALRSFGTALSVWTRADVWLPFTLTARAQPVVAALNAPRLRAALEAIEAIVGQPGYGEDTRFAHIDGYELRNHHVRGEILDLQDMGNDESWIAERWPEPEPA